MTFFMVAAERESPGGSGWVRYCKVLDVSRRCWVNVLVC